MEYLLLIDRVRVVICDDTGEMFAVFCHDRY
jgi:hypothetical protein